MYIRNFYESSRTAKNINFESIIKQVENPVNYEDPKKSPLIYGFSYKDGVALKENATSVEYILLDYEKSKTIEEFIEEYKEFQFYLYTTTGYKIKDDSDRYRVILPLDRSYTIDEYEPYCKRVKSKNGNSVLSWFFVGCDLTCFDINHGQRVPAFTEHYKFVINEGRNFSLSDIPESLMDRFKRELAIEKLNESSKKIRKYKKTVDYTKEQTEEYFENKLERTLIRLNSENTFNWRKSGTGQGTDMWLFKAASSLVKCRMSRNEIIDTLLNFTHGKRKKEIEHKVDEAFRRN